MSEDREVYDLPADAEMAPDGGVAPMMDRPTSYLTPEWVADRVEDIRAVASDPEAAHGLEDALWQIVLEYIEAHNAEDYRLCAFAALQTRTIEFPRWTA